MAAAVGRDPFLRGEAEKTHMENELVSVTRSAAAPAWWDEVQVVGSGLFVPVAPKPWLCTNQSCRLEDSGMVFLAPASAEPTLMTQLENSRACF